MKEMEGRDLARIDQVTTVPPIRMNPFSVRGMRDLSLSANATLVSGPNANSPVLVITCATNANAAQVGRRLPLGVKVSPPRLPTGADICRILG